MKIMIKPTMNGVFIEIFTEDAETPSESYSYDTENYIGEDNLEKQQEVMYQIMDLLGWCGSKHDAKRLRLNIETQEN